MDPVSAQPRFVRPHLAETLALIGQPGSRRRIPTPAAVLDLDGFEANIALMAGRARTAGLALRPHAKSHKCARVALRQIETGAVGVCCAKLAEAEALAAAGVKSILVTSPIAGDAPSARAAGLAGRIADFRIVLDHPDAAAELGAAAQSTIQVLVDVDVGLGRTGVHDVEQARAVGRAIATQPNLRLIGVQGYGGHWQHMAGANARADAVAAGMARLQATAQALRADGHDIAVLTGGGTGTFTADAAQGLLTEVQPGSYAFMDREYRDALGTDPEGAFVQSLTIAATVISVNHPHWVTVDAGLKAFSTDGPLPQAVTPGFEGCGYRFFGDEHGRLTRPAHPVGRGERVAFAPGHIDPTLDRYDVLHLVRGEVLEAVVPLEARGASQ